MRVKEISVWGNFDSRFFLQVVDNLCSPDTNFYVYVTVVKPNESSRETSRTLHLLKVSYPTQTQFTVMSVGITRDTIPSDSYRLASGSWKLYFQGGKFVKGLCVLQRPRFCTTIFRLHEQWMEGSEQQNLPKMV